MGASLKDYIIHLCELKDCRISVFQIVDMCYFRGVIIQQNMVSLLDFNQILNLYMKYPKFIAIFYL